MNASKPNDALVTWASTGEALVDWLSGLNSYQDWLDRDKDLAAVEAADVNTILRAIGQPGRQIVSVLSPAT